MPNVNNGNPIPRFSPPDKLGTVNMIVERFEIDICVTIIITLFRAEYIYRVYIFITFESGIVYIIR